MPRLQTLKPRVPMLSTTRAPAPAENYGQGRGGRPWRRLRRKILERDRYACQVEETVKGKQVKCGRISPDNEVDHKRPVSQGGTDDESNLQTICVDHHKAKTQQESKGGTP